MFHAPFILNCAAEEQRLVMKRCQSQGSFGRGDPIDDCGREYFKEAAVLRHAQNQYTPAEHPY